MKITGFRIEHYLMKMDRAVGDANLPSGVDLMPGSILYIDTDENITGISLGFGGLRASKCSFRRSRARTRAKTSGLWIRMNDFLHKAGNEGAASAALERHRHRAVGSEGERSPASRCGGRSARRQGRVKAYASGLDYCLSDEELFAFYRRMAERGIGSRQAQGGARSRRPICAGSASCARR